MTANIIAIVSIVLFLTSAGIAGYWKGRLSNTIDITELKVKIDILIKSLEEVIETLKEKEKICNIHAEKIVILSRDVKTAFHRIENIEEDLKNIKEIRK